MWSKSLTASMYLSPCLSKQLLFLSLYFSFSIFSLSFFKHPAFLYLPISFKSLLNNLFYSHNLPTIYSIYTFNLVLSVFLIFLRLKIGHCKTIILLLFFARLFIILNLSIFMQQNLCVTSRNSFLCGWTPFFPMQIVYF